LIEVEVEVELGFDFEAGFDFESGFCPFLSFSVIGAGRGSSLGGPGRVTSLVIVLILLLTELEEGRFA